MKRNKTSTDSWNVKGRGRQPSLRRFGLVKWLCFPSGQYANDRPADRRGGHAARVNINMETYTEEYFEMHEAGYKNEQSARQDLEMKTKYG